MQSPSDSDNVFGKPVRRKGSRGRDLGFSWQASPVFRIMGDILSSSALGTCLIYLDFPTPHLDSIGCELIKLTKLVVEKEVDFLKMISILNKVMILPPNTDCGGM